MLTTLLAERPLLLSLMLGVVAAGAIYGWLQTGKRAALLVAGIAVALIPVAWVVAERWVTDREQIEQMLYDVAEAVESNDHERAAEVIADEQLRQRAIAELRHYEFSHASIRGIRRLEVRGGTFPPEADVELNVKVVVSRHGMQIRDMTILRRLLLKLEKHGAGGDPGRWVVVDYQHGPIAGGADSYSTIAVP